MTIPNYILNILVCPETKQPLTLASPEEIDNLNQRISRCESYSVNGVLIVESVSAGLIREDRSICYPIREGIPVLLAEEGIVIP